MRWKEGLWLLGRAPSSSSTWARIGVYVPKDNDFRDFAGDLLGLRSPDSNLQRDFWISPMLTEHLRALYLAPIQLTRGTDMNCRFAKIVKIGTLNTIEHSYCFWSAENWTESWSRKSPLIWTLHRCAGHATVRQEDVGTYLTEPACDTPD